MPESPIFAVQYLEDRPEIASISPVEARARLKVAFDQLPISMVMLGWNLPPALLEACAEECALAGAAVYRWHPLLTGDGKFVPESRWQTIDLNGDPVLGFQNMPEFTFVCPNRPEARAAVLAHLSDQLKSGLYQGLFLDRIRFPSPTVCFCEDCQRTAAGQGLDLEALRRQMISISPADWIRGLFSAPGTSALAQFLDFRAQSIYRFLLEVTALIHEQGLAVGLDCFSPTLTRLVGQDLHLLDGIADWIKIMSYGHALGPAGIPFELLKLAQWLVEKQNFTEPDALALLSEATQLPLSPDLAARGLSPEALRLEASRACTLRTKVLAGIELVQLPGITDLSEPQIRADLAAFRASGVQGLVLSWDLWAIPPQYLALVRQGFAL